MAPYDLGQKHIADMLSGVMPMVLPFQKHAEILAPVMEFFSGVNIDAIAQDQQKIGMFQQYIQQRMQMIQQEAMQQQQSQGGVPSQTQQQQSQPQQ